MKAIGFAVLILVASLALAGTMAAQDAGQYVIVNAQYGNEYHHVDVTKRLQEMTRHETRFHVNHNAMNADPDPGQAKGLRVFAREADGDERVFDFPDGSIFESRQFRGQAGADWGNANWDGGWAGHARGGQYVILTAQYGNEWHHLEVTQQLREMAQKNMSFKLTYRVFGDPDKGHAKSLRIFARGSDGQERMFEYQDNTMVDGSVFRGWGGGQWGNGGWSGNWAGGGDAGQFLILGAQYGNDRRHVDVTEQLREMARRDLTFRLDYRTFGVDPDEGHGKSLRIYTRGAMGRTRVFEYRDGSVIDGAMFQGWGGGNWGREWGGRWDADDEHERHEEREHDRE